MLKPREPRWGDGIYECDGCGCTLPEHLVTEVPGAPEWMTINVPAIQTSYLCPDCVTAL